MAKSFPFAKKSGFKTFFEDENGAVTVDWVVLTALLVGLVAVAFAGVEGGVAALTGQLVAYLTGLL
ncbi:MAG: hypothetical protein AAFN80_00325 [Pseudomonadota bacterium]